MEHSSKRQVVILRDSALYLSQMGLRAVVISNFDLLILVLFGGERVNHYLHSPLIIGVLGLQCAVVGWILVIRFSS